MSDATDPIELERALAAVVGERGVTRGDSIRELHAGDLSFHTAQRPDIVVYPTSTDEVAQILALANERRVAVVAFGAGTSLEGHVIPLQGGICLDLSRLDRILSVSPGNFTATVQAGVTRLALERAVGEEGLFFPWRQRTLPARRRCDTGRCARTSLRSRPCLPTGA